MWLLIRKPLQPVVVARHLRSSVLSLILLLGFSSLTWAEIQPYVAILHAHTAQELSGILDEAEAWSNQSKSYQQQPIAIVLHGDEAKPFIKQNYKQHQALVDKAAKLDAFKVVDIKICETWMGSNGITRDQLPPFVETVPLGLSEEKRLIEAGYQQF
ncbi:hypothetical protein NBRC116188_29090 [Oceaniserpentilla sp. 4NH20-0058]|uniref:DsrE family protein n=1 Tax=Oceaniserpentilla sp. 4NH20-0058 TaxID=3127660 RepID=UPI00310B72B9